jgi:hypothetical protein
MADLAVKSPIPNHQSDEECKSEAREWLQKVAAVHRVRKAVSLPTTQPTAEEVAMDVARVQRQIAEIKRKGKAGAASSKKV